MRSPLKKHLDTVFPKHHREIAKLLSYFDLFHLSGCERKDFCNAVIFGRTPFEQEAFWMGFAKLIRLNHQGVRDIAGDHIESLIDEHNIRKVNLPLSRPVEIPRITRRRLWEVILDILMPTKRRFRT